MAGINSTATTPEELAKQFPHTLRPFAVLYNDDPGCDSRKWAVNNESGETTQEFEDMATALKAAAEMGSEWDAEARKQAQALAKVVESNDAELLDIQARLELMMSGKDDGAKNRIVKTVVCKMADFLPDIDVDAHLSAERFPMTSSRNPFEFERYRGLVPDEVIRRAYSHRRNWAFDQAVIVRVRQLAGVIDADMRQVRRSDATPEEKRQRLDELTVERNALLKAAVLDSKEQQKKELVQ